MTRELGVPGLAGAVVAGVVLAYSAAYAPLVAVATFGAIFLIIAMVTRAELLLFVLVAAVPWEGMLEYPSATVTVIKLLGALLVVAYLFRAFTHGDRLRYSPILIAGLVFTIFVALSLMASDDPGASVSKSLRYAFFFVFLFLVSQLVQHRETAYALVRVLVVSATVAAIYGLYGYLSGSLTRAAGPLADANDFAYLVAAVLPLAALLLLEDRRLRGLWLASLALLLAATLATLSRGALVGLGALAVWAIASRRVGPGGVLTGAFVVTLVAALALTLWGPLINESVKRKQNIGEANVQSRVAFWSAASRMSLEHPVLGIGPGRFGEKADTYLRNNPIAIPDPVVHNSYLEILVENGVFAAIAFLAMLGTAWVSLGRAEREARDVGDRSSARLAAAVKGTLVISIVAGLFLSEQLTVPFWLVCGLAASAALGQLETVPRIRAARPAVALR